MNPTDEVDDLLTRAGARWRADQPSAPEPDLDQITGRRPRRWVPALAAASVAVIAAAAITILPDGTPKPTAGPSSVDTPQSFAEGNQDPNRDLFVREGDRVQVGGQVILAPGKDPEYCPSIPKIAIGWPAGKEPAPTCPADVAVKLKNFDPDQLAQVKTIKGVRTGYAQLTGTWSNRTIDVTEQRLPEIRSTTAELNIPPDQVPCAAPAGGWRTGPNVIDKVAVSRFLTPRENQSTDPRLLYPNGRVPGAPEVYTIGVAHGDLAAFRSAFQKVYAGNLCVYQVKFSKAEMTQLADKVADLTPTGLGVYRTGPTEVDKIGVHALVYDEALRTALTQVGLENLEIETDIKPLR